MSVVNGHMSISSSMRDDVTAQRYRGGEGLAALRNLKRLKTLNLSRCALEDGELANLASLSNLQSLSLAIAAEPKNAGLHKLRASLLEQGKLKEAAAAESK